MVIYEQPASSTFVAKPTGTLNTKAVIFKVGQNPLEGIFGVGKVEGPGNVKMGGDF